VLLRCLLGGSWGLLRHVGKLLGPLGSLLAPLGASWRPLGNLLGPLGGVVAPLGGLLGASWRLLEPLGGLLGASSGGLWLILVPLERSLAGLGASWVEKWPWLQREHDFGSSQVASLAGKWPWLEREQDFQGAAGGAHRFRNSSGSAQAERFGTPPAPPKLIAKAISDTIMS
jgi:hypothetical protein